MDLAMLLHTRVCWCCRVSITSNGVAKPAYGDVVAPLVCNEEAWDAIATAVSAFITTHQVWAMIVMYLLQVVHISRLG